MEWIEVTGRTVEEAKELALDRLGVVEAELEYEVVEEARGGFLGIGRSEARIRARVMPVSREKPGDRRQRRGRARAGGSERAPRGNGGNRRPAAGNGDDRDAGAPAPHRKSRPSRRGRGGRSGAGAPAPEEQTHPRSVATEAEGVNESTLSIEEQASAAATFTRELVAHFGLSAAVHAEVVDDDIELRVDGDGLGVLVGPRGVTLQALEELTRAVVQHVAGGHSARLHLDVAGYRERRRQALAEFALRIASEVIETGEEKALEAMPAPDRKVVHDAVADLDGVMTTSEGEEPRRRVVIRPA